MITGATFAVSRRAILPFQGLVGMPNTKGLRITNRHENAARVALDVIGNGWNRIFVSIRDAEHFVSDDAGTTRRAKRGGQGAVTGETKMGTKRIVNRKPISPSNRALPASFRLRSSPRVVGFRVSAEGPDGLDGKSRPVSGLSGNIFRPMFSGAP